MSSNSIFNLAGITEPVASVASKLIDKLSDGVGWIASRKTSKGIAIETYIEEIKNSDLNTIVKAAFIYDAKKIIKEYCNQNNIIAIASELLISTAQPEAVENDWLNQFMDKARLVSDEEFQLIWGKILAEECNAPNSIPKTLLNILSQMDKSDARTFSAICSVMVCVEDDNEISFFPIIKTSNIDELCSKIDIKYGALVNLQALGLIEMTLFPPDYFYAMKFCKTPVVIKYHNNVYELPEGMNTLTTGNILLTKAGDALCNTLKISEEQDGFWEEFCMPALQEAVKDFNDNMQKGSSK